MIELPNNPAPNAVTITPVDYGLTLRPATGAAVTRIDRPGSRYRLQVGFPPMRADVARVFVSRLQQAMTEGLRIKLPLLGISQGSPGLAVVDGDGQSGTSLAVKNMTPGYAAKEGFWATLIDADGVRYLHNIKAPSLADASGDATLQIWPMIRAPMADGDSVNLYAPEVEGLVGDISWNLELGDIVTLGFTLEEAA